MSLLKEVGRETLKMANTEHLPWNSQRAVKTVQYRINLLNMFETFLNKEFDPITLGELNINIDNQNSVECWLYKTSERIEKMREYFENKGTAWQKNRCAEEFVRGVHE